MAKAKPNLLERQSARTTFRMSEAVSDILDSLIEDNSIKPKEIFELMCSNENLLQIAVDVTKKDRKEDSGKGIRKTFVISKGALRILSRSSKKEIIPRDQLVETLIVLFKTLLEKQAVDQKENNKKASRIVSDLWSEAEEVEGKLKEFLDDDDPILDRISMVIVVIQNLSSAIEANLSEDIPIDPDEL